MEFNCNCWLTNTDAEPSGKMAASDIQPPPSGYRFDPSDAFEDYKIDNYEFGKRNDAAIIRAREEARELSRKELKRMYQDVDRRQPGIVEAADDYWGSLTPEERDPIVRYTASDQMDLNNASRGKAEMTDQASDEMDKVSALLDKAPKYTAGNLYRVINLESEKKVVDLQNDLDANIWGLKGFNSTSTTMDAAKKYIDPKQKYQIVFHVVSSRNGAFVGQYSHINTDKEVLFDRKCKFRALQSWEPGYIKTDGWKDGLIHIAIVEV